VRAAERAAVCGSARSSARLPGSAAVSVSAAMCGSAVECGSAAVCGSVRQFAAVLACSQHGAQQCATVRQCERRCVVVCTRQYAARCGSV
jgi:hypothetical protein